MESLVTDFLAQVQVSKLYATRTSAALFRSRDKSPVSLNEARFNHRTPNVEHLETVRGVCQIGCSSSICPLCFIQASFVFMFSHVFAALETKTQQLRRGRWSSYTVERLEKLVIGKAPSPYLVYRRV